MYSLLSTNSCSLLQSSIASRGRLQSHVNRHAELDRIILELSQMTQPWRDTTAWWETRPQLLQRLTDLYQSRTDTSQISGTAIANAVISARTDLHLDREELIASVRDAVLESLRGSKDDCANSFKIMEEPNDGISQRGDRSDQDVEGPIAGEEEETQPSEVDASTAPVVADMYEVEQRHVAIESSKTAKKRVWISQRALLRAFFRNVRNWPQRRQNLTLR
ncbi:hypothetical protein MRB53_040268 [Persea americana]|nr:hypothetical protein MRB53_040268 [Persea americana]